MRSGEESRLRRCHPVSRARRLGFSPGFLVPTGVAILTGSLWIEPVIRRINRSAVVL